MTITDLIEQAATWAARLGTDVETYELAIAMPQYDDDGDSTATR